MKCLTKIHHRRLIYSFLFVVSSLFLSVLGSASDSYATSSTCTLTFNLNAESVFTSFCTTDPVYIRLDSVSLNIDSGSGFSSGSDFNIFITYGGTNFLYTFYRHNITFSSFPVSFSDNSASSVVHPNFYYYDGSPSRVGITNNNVYFRTGLASPSSGSATVTFSYSSDLSDLGGGASCTEPEEPEPCPPIPENPYDDKLDEIKTAIYCASAVMIMIYFFFIVYKIIIKDGGRR